MCLWIWLGDCTINAPHRFPKRVYMTFSCAVPNKKYTQKFSRRKMLMLLLVFVLKYLTGRAILHQKQSLQKKKNVL